MTYHVFHTAHGVPVAAHVMFDVYRDVVDYIDRVFLPSCRDGMAHVFHGDTITMSVCVADGAVTYRRPMSDRFMM